MDFGAVYDSFVDDYVGMVYGFGFEARFVKSELEGLEPNKLVDGRPNKPAVYFFSTLGSYLFA